MFIALAFLAGSALGAAVMFLYLRPRLQAPQLAEQLREAFKATASDVLKETATHTSATLLTLASEKLGAQQQQAEGMFTAKTQEVQTTLGTLKDQMAEKVTALSARLETLEKERAQQYTALDQRLGQAAEVIGKLQTTTGSLTQALANSRVRGQWGERMADDVLRLAGLQEGISYTKQTSLEGGRPDFSFPLPGGRTLHMDVKFPLDGYLTTLNAASDVEREGARKSFLQATRNHIKTTGTRPYRTQADAMDYVLMFIPNEQVYAFLFEHDAELLSYALSQHVILCSPTTLLAVLSLVREAEKAFMLDQQYAELAKNFAGFTQQWRLFSDAHDTVKKAFDKVAREFDELVGKRTTLLDKAVDKLTLTAPAAGQSSLAEKPSLLSPATPQPDLLN